MKGRREGFVHTFGVAKYVYLADYERLEQELRDKMAYKEKVGK